MSYWICDKDQNCIDCPKHYPEETCEHWIEVEPVKDIQTNADRIRSMTDDKLAGFLAFTGCPQKVMASLCPRGHNSDKKCNARRCWLNWLKQEVEQ